MAPTQHSACVQAAAHDTRFKTTLANIKLLSWQPDLNSCLHATGTRPLLREGAVTCVSHTGCCTWQHCKHHACNLMYKPCSTSALLQYDGASLGPACTQLLCIPSCSHSPNQLGPTATASRLPTQPQTLTTRFATANTLDTATVSCMQGDRCGCKLHAGAMAQHHNSSWSQCQQYTPGPTSYCFHSFTALHHQQHITQATGPIKYALQLAGRHKLHHHQQRYEGALCAGGLYRNDREGLG